MSSCENCRVLQDKLDRIRAILDDAVAVPRGRQVRVVTDAGRAMASAASALGLRLTEASVKAGFAADYAGKVCRGELPLSRRAALLFGGVLKVDLMPYVKDERAGKGEPPAAEPLPFPISGVEVAS